MCVDGVKNSTVVALVMPTTNKNDQQQQKQAPRFRHYGCRPISPCFVIAPEGPAKKKVAVGLFWPGAHDTTSSQSQPEKGYLQVF